MAIDISTLPATRPYSNITPFTVRDGITYLLKLESLDYWLREILVPHVDKEVSELVENWQAVTVALVEKVNEELANQDAQIDAKLAEQIAEFNTVVQQVINSSIEVQDPVLAGILENAASASRLITDGLYASSADVTGLQGSVTTLEELTDTGRLSTEQLTSVFATELSAAPYLIAGAANNAAGLQTAADLARDMKVTLYVPPGDWNIGSEVSVYTSMRCDGRFVINNASGRIWLKRTVVKSAINPSSVTGLVRGSTQLTGIPNAGTVIVKSTEELIKRILGSAFGAPYVKQEALIMSASGELNTPVTDTYDTSLINAIDYYPEEELLSIDNLSILTNHIDTTALDNVLRLERSNVVVNNLKIRNIFSISNGPQSAVRLQESTNVTFNNPDINGFLNPNSGYGIAKYMSTNIVINNPSLTDCRHGVTGRNDHSVIINGGYVDGVDTHWGWNLVLNDVNVKVGLGGNAVLVAGGNLTIRGGRYEGGRSMVGYRLDTPEFGGYVRVSGSEWVPSIEPLAPDRWIVGYSSVNNNAQGGLDFGRVLDSADIFIDDVKVTLLEDAGFTAVYLGDMTFDRVIPGRININNVRGNSRVTRQRDALVYLNRGNLAVGELKMIVSNISRPVHVDSTFSAPFGTNENVKLDILYKDAGRVGLQVPNGLAKVVVNNCELFRLLGATTTAPFTKPHKIMNSRINTAAFSGSWQADFINNVWEGVTTSSNLSLTGRPASSIGNSKLIGAEAPNVADGYRSPTYYAV